MQRTIRRLRELLAHAVRELTRPFDAGQMVDAEGSRTRFLIAGFVIVALTLDMPTRTQVEWRPALAVLFLAALTAMASLSPYFRPALHRYGGVVITGEITGLVLFTGGPDSPYRVLYPMLLVYAAVFYPARRLLATGLLLALVSLLPYLSIATDGAYHWRPMVIQLTVWAAIAAVVHGLVEKVRLHKAQLAENYQRYRSLFEPNPDAIFSLDPEGRFTEVNAAAARLFGHDQSAIVGVSYESIAPADALPGVRAHIAAALNGEPKSCELAFAGAAGRRVVGLVMLLPITVDGEIVGVHGMVKDITDLRDLQEQLAEQALHDSLTGLANRALFTERLQEELAKIRRSQLPVSVLILDLDGFKPVNDAHGHAAGDALLVEVGHRLTALLRPGDTLARLGGDEFGIILPEADAAAAAEVAQRVTSAIEAPARIDGVTICVRASTGAATTTDWREDPETLIGRADAAMYQAKRTVQEQGLPSQR